MFAILGLVLVILLVFYVGSQYKKQDPPIVNVAPPPLPVLDCKSNEVIGATMTYHANIQTGDQLFAMNPTTFNKVDEYTCDIGFDYWPLGKHVETVSKDKRRFTYRWDGQRWVTVSMGDSMSGTTI